MGVIGVIGVELVSVSGGTLIGTFLLEGSFKDEGFTADDNDNEGDDTLVLFVLPEDTEEDGGADDLL